MSAMKKDRNTDREKKRQKGNYKNRRKQGKKGINNDRRK
jgi:hypothetical protein